ncbi:DUF935 domain-containing protein [Sphingobium cloacae]|uniref:DUF935 domain-containing protein n=1 Tax=Sphingobium cloacae TaxID=120107 RepID=A0A1E1F2N3_9SPHN|nr:DUF935 domain-containing protein [Sphingobium cloacae]BAV64774.1 hypothetical protein SCLO_1017340 [Sphingobium cloacae]
MTGLIDHRGQPLRREVLTREVAGPRIGGVRSPMTGYPGDGLNPVKLARILRAADMGDPLAYFELAEQIEERDPHYVGVLGTRKRSVAQIDATVDAASDDAGDVAIADRIREWIDRDELADETFDILDAIGKGDSFTEIVWDSSSGQWQPARLEWRDPRWFTYDPRDGRTPLLRGGEEGGGADSPLPPFKFIRHQVKAKSGLPVRSGIARIAAWGWMFKAFTQRDWAIFVQTYGQPVRIGKFRSGASDEDKDTLFRAVANIAGDCAAIIPDGMDIDFKESRNVGPGSDLYEKRADWLDRQTSKAVLGQTTTTDAVSGGHAVAKEHRLVQEDIETADCKGLSATLNRDLIRPWVDLEYGPQRKYPRLRIARPKAEDVSGLVSALQTLVPMGMRVQASEIRDKLGLSDPDAGAELLRAPASPSSIAQPSQQLIRALQAAQAPAATFPADAIGDRLADDADADIGEWLEQIEAMLSAANDLGEFAEMLRSAFPRLDAQRLAAKIGKGLTAAHAAGRFDVEEEADA